MALTSKIDQLKAEREQFERDFQARLEAMKQAEQELLKASEAGEKLVAAVKKINLDPVLAYEILVDAGLIQAPVIAQDEDEELPIIATFVNPPQKENGRSSTLNVRAGDDVELYRARNKGLWTVVYSKGYDYFMTGLTAHGKTWIESDEGKAWLQKIFK